MSEYEYVPTPFDAHLALETIDYSFPNYTPSDDALEFFNLMRLVEGKDFEYNTPLFHYFIIDAIFGHVKAENFPYSDEVKKTIHLNQRRIAIVATRGGAKSSVVTKFLPLYLAIKGRMPKNKQKIRFVIGIAASAEGGARVISKALGAMINESEFCQEYFESIRITESEVELVRKGKGSAKNRTFLMRNMGWAGGIRGIRDSYGERPDMALLDDIIPNSAAAHSETQMDQLNTIVQSDILNALIGGNKGYVISVATPFTENDVVWKTLTSGVYTPLIFPICEKIDEHMTPDEIVSIWPAMHPPQAIYEQYIAAKMSGNLQSFMQERMLRITSEEDRLIPEHMLSWYDNRNLILKNIHNFTVIITTDFTAGNTKKGDYSGIAVWAINVNDDKFLVDLFLQKCTIQEQYDALFNFVQKWGTAGTTLEVGVEIDGQQQLNINRLEAMMIERNVWFRFARQKGKPASQTGIRTSGMKNKLERLRATIPDFEMHRIKFPRELQDTAEMKELLSEIRKTNTSIITSVHDDGLDLISQLMLIDYPKASTSISSPDTIEGWDIDSLSNENDEEYSRSSVIF